MTRREKAIELGRELGEANRDNPKGIETLRLLVDEWQGAIVDNRDGEPHIRHRFCVACKRHADPTDRDCFDCPFTMIEDKSCIDLAKRTLVGPGEGFRVHPGQTFLGIDGASLSDHIQIRDDIVAFLKSAVKAAEPKETEDDQTRKSD